MGSFCERPLAFSLLRSLGTNAAGQLLSLSSLLLLRLLFCLAPTANSFDVFFGTLSCVRRQKRDRELETLGRDNTRAIEEQVVANNTQWKRVVAAKQDKVRLAFSSSSQRGQ